MGRAFFLSFPPSLSYPPSYSTPPQQSIYFSLLLIQSKAEQVKSLRFSSLEQNRRRGFHDRPTFSESVAHVQGLHFPITHVYQPDSFAFLGLVRGTDHRQAKRVCFDLFSPQDLFHLLRHHHQARWNNTPKLPSVNSVWLVSHPCGHAQDNLSTRHFQSQQNRGGVRYGSNNWLCWLAIALMTPKKRDRRPVINQATQ